MEQVINAELRNEAFGKFIIFFLLTTAIIVTAVYINFKIPSENSEMLREKVTDYESQLYHQQQFITAMVKARSFIDSMNKPGQNNAFLKGEVNKQLRIMERPEYKDSSRYAVMNQEIINMLYSYDELNARIIKSKDAMQEVEKLKSELSTCETRRADADRNLAIYRNSSIGY